MPQRFRTFDRVCAPPSCIRPVAHLRSVGMGKARKIEIWTRTFEKAGDASAFFKEMLNRYKVGERVNEADTPDLMALLERHDERNDKIGSGICYFTVDAPPEDAPPFSERCFWIVRNDGTVVDFSYKHCLERKLGD